MFLKSKTKSQRVLERLIRGAERGVTNRELNDIMFRYGSVIHGLRKDGHIIRTHLVKRGLYKYYYEGRR